MTTKEKAERIREYCDDRGSYCADCPLFELPEDGCHESSVPDYAIERNYAILFEGAPVEPDPDRRDYWANVCAIQKRQTEKGIRTYGQRLEDNKSLTPLQRLEYLEEELIDALMYIEHIKTLFPEEVTT